MVDYFNKKKIKPNPPVKAAKNWKIAAAAPVQQVDESFYANMKMEMVKKCVKELGMPQAEVQAFLDTHGIAENDVDQIETNLRAPGY